MGRAHYQGARSSSPDITPLGGKFEKTQRQVNGPKPQRAPMATSCEPRVVAKTFSLEGKKMMGGEKILPFQFGHSSYKQSQTQIQRQTAGGAGCETPGSPLFWSPAKRQGSSKFTVDASGGGGASPSAFDAASLLPPKSGPLPSGTEHSIDRDLGGKKRGSSPSVAAKGINFTESPAHDYASGPHSGRRSIAAPTANNVEYSQGLHSNRSDFVKVDRGKSCSMEKHLDPGYMAPTSASAFKSSQRYCTSPLRSFESNSQDQAARKPCIRVASPVTSTTAATPAYGRKDSLTGVMQAAPAPAPKKQSTPAPWAPWPPTLASIESAAAAPAASRVSRVASPRPQVGVADTTSLGGTGGSTDQRHFANIGRRSSSPRPQAVTSLNPQRHGSREIQPKSTIRTYNTRSSSPIASWE